MMSPPRSAQTLAKSRIKPVENSVRAPRGRPLRLPDCPGNQRLGYFVIHLFPSVNSDTSRRWGGLDGRWGCRILRVAIEGGDFLARPHSFCCFLLFPVKMDASGGLNSCRRQPALHYSPPQKPLLSVLLRVVRICCGCCCG